MSKAKPIAETPDRNTELPATLRDRVEAALSDPTTNGYSPEILKVLLSNIEKTTSDINRSALLLLLFIAAFEFMAQAIIQEVSLGPFKLNNTTVIYKALPTIVAYFAHNIVLLETIRFEDFRMYHYIIQKLYNSLYKHKLTNYLLPNYSTLTYGFSDETTKRNKSVRILNLTSLITSTIGILGVPIFEISAFYQLFYQFKLTDILVWSSLFITAILLLRSIAVMFLPND